jgi:hypothetical protein
MPRSMNEIEKKWFHVILNHPFKDIDIIKNQLSNVQVEYNYYTSNIAVRSLLQSEVDIFPYRIRIPVEVRAYQENRAPIVFLLHMKNGYIHELEVFSADLEAIDINNIELDNLEYCIDESLTIEIETKA